MKKTDPKEIKQALKSVKVGKKLDRFFRECAKEERRLHREQGKRFDELFPEVQKLRTMSTCNDRNLNGAQTVIFVGNLRRIGIKRDVIIDYLCGHTTFPEFLRRLGQGVTLNAKQRIASLADDLSEYLEKVDIERMVN